MEKNVPNISNIEEFLIKVLIINYIKIIAIYAGKDNWGKISTLWGIRGLIIRRLNSAIKKTTCLIMMRLFIATKYLYYIF
jgi:hypothetical protein